MKRNFKGFFTSIFIAVVVVGCNSSRDSKTIERITVYPESGQGLQLSSIVDNVEIIPLQLTDSSSMGSINKVVYFDGKLFFHEWRTEKVLCFSDNGSFLFQVGAIGKAEGEYTTLCDFNINPYTKQIEIYDIMNNKLLCYDLEGNYLNDSFKIGYKARAYTIVDSSNYVFFNDCRFESVPYNLFTSKMDSFQPENIQIKSLGERDLMNQPCPFSNYKNSVLFSYSLNDTIYKVTNKGAEPLYKIDFIGERINDHVLEKSMEEIVEYSMNNQVPSFVSNLVENNMSISFSYFYGSNEKENIVFYNKKSKQTVNIYNCVNDINYLPLNPPFCAIGGRFLSIVPAFEVVSALEEAKKLRTTNPSAINIDAFDRLSAIAGSIKEFDNPVLLIYNIKTNL